MKIIGITGPSGAGKSSLTEYFKKASIPVSDADSLYHELLESSEDLRTALAAEFGECVTSEGKIDRKALAGIVFAPGAEERLARLNEITHAFVLREVRAFLSECEAHGEGFAAIDVPLLFESGISDDCDYTVSVLASRDVRLERIKSRDSLSDEEAEKRLSAQKDDEFYTSRSSRVIYNNGKDSELELEFMKLASRLGIILGGDK